MHAAENRFSRAGPDGDIYSVSAARTSRGTLLELNRHNDKDRVRRSLLRGRTCSAMRASRPPRSTRTSCRSQGSVSAVRSTDSGQEGDAGLGPASERAQARWPT